MPGGTIDPDRFDELRALHAEGKGRNAIAREMGVPPVMVSRTAERLGLDFDRSKIQAATEARLADLAERRTLLAEQFHDVAEDSLNRIYEETTVYAFGGKDNVYEDHTFSEAPAAERRALVAAASAAVDRSLKLVPAEQSSNLESAKSMLGSLGEALTAFSRAEDEAEAAEAEAGVGEA